MRASLYSHLGIASKLDQTDSSDHAETLAYVLNDLHWVYVALGDFRQAQSCLEEAVERWCVLRNVPMLLDSLNGSGLLYSLIGRFDQALAAAEEGANLAKSVGNVWNQNWLRRIERLLL